LKEWIPNIIVLGRIFLSTLFWATCILLISLWSRKKERERALAHRWIDRLVAIAEISIDLTIEEPFSPADGPFIFMANHQSFMDIPILAIVLRQFSLSWVALSWLVNVPFFGWAFKRLDPVLVKPGNKRINSAAMKTARETLFNGNSLLVFPEGERSWNGQLSPLKTGFFKLALESEVPIVPVTIAGAGQLLPPGSCKVKHGTVRVNVGKRLVPGQWLVEDLKEAIRVNLDNHLRDREEVWDSCGGEFSKFQSAGQPTNDLRDVAWIWKNFL
jgi:1-acyl-sn-glycerol-3-phosphate acyltransferase